MIDKIRQWGLVVLLVIAAILNTAGAVANYGVAQELQTQQIVLDGVNESLDTLYQMQTQTLEGIQELNNLPQSSQQCIIANLQDDEYETDETLEFVTRLAPTLLENPHMIQFMYIYWLTHSNLDIPTDDLQKLLPLPETSLYEDNSRE